MAETPLLLEGLRVLDVASFIAAPAAATVLADFGADVVKVEPLDGDPYRKLINQPGHAKVDSPYHWFLDNRHKRSIALDLKQPEGRAVLLRLAAEADVFVTNYPLDVRERLQLRYEDIAPLNDRLIYASMTAYGERGDEAARPGFDSTAWWARSGMMDLVRPDPDGPPARSLPGMGDHATAMSLYAAIVTALYRRERTGKGSHVASSLLANGLWSNGFNVQAALGGAEIPRRPRQEMAANAMANHYRCRDGHWFILALLNEAAQWPVLVRAIGREDLMDDPRFASTEARHGNAAALVAIFNAVFAERDWHEWHDILLRNRLPYGNVENMTDILEDRQMFASGALVDVTDPAQPWRHTIDSPLQIADVDKRSVAGAPEIGQHTTEILEAAGYSAEDIARLRHDNVAGGG